MSFVSLTWMYKGKQVIAVGLAEKEEERVGYGRVGAAVECRERRSVGLHLRAPGSILPVKP